MNLCLQALDKSNTCVAVTEVHAFLRGPLQARISDMLENPRFALAPAWNVFAGRLTEVALNRPLPFLFGNHTDIKENHVTDNYVVKIQNALWVPTSRNKIWIELIWLSVYWACAKNEVVQDSYRSLIDDELASHGQPTLAALGV